MSNQNIQRSRLVEKTALITGATSGIGKATAILLVREGAKVAALECAQDGDNIRVNTFWPGGVMTPM